MPELLQGLRIRYRLMGNRSRAIAPVKKTIYSLIDLREILLACNRRYLAHLSALDDFSAGARALDRLTKPRSVEGKTVKGVNFFDPIDNALLNALQNPRVNIAGIRRADLRRSSANSPPHASPGNCAGCATSAQSSAPPEPIDTTSPESAEPQQQHSAASPRASSSRPSHEP